MDVFDLDTMLQPTTFPSSGQLLAEFEREHRLPFVFSRGSGRGWSYFSALQRCPQEFNLTYVRPPKGEPPATPYPLEIGAYYHAFQALSLSEPPVPTPSVLRQFLYDRNANPETVNEAWRIFYAYVDYYVGDYLEPLAVEYTALDKRANLSCRYDLIARIPTKNQDLFPPGTVVVERKSAAAFTLDVLDGWDLDGEILGQLLLWDRCGLSKKFGPLQGVIIDIAGKQKVPQFHRTFVRKSSFKMKRHLQALKHMQEQERRYRKANVWPMFTANCIRRYGRCEKYDLCRAESKR